MPQLASYQIQDLVDTCSRSTQLRLPAKLSEERNSGTVTAGNADKLHADICSYLTGLLLHDPGVFLERHGLLLTADQRKYFQPLREDYEINFYLMLAEDDAARCDTAYLDQKPALSARAKNRRLAKMTRLEKEGFFDEETARKRAPLLHHHYLGQYEPARAPVRASTLQDQIIEQHEERQIAEHLAKERQEEAQATAAFEATLSESEDESSDNESAESMRDAHSESPALEVPVKPGHELQDSAAPHISAEDLQQNREEFGELMRARFLNGEDGAREADEDSSLDNDWEKECQQDIEDKYFDS